MHSLNVAQFATRDRVEFQRALDRQTQRLVVVFPRGRGSWGLARKLLNIFLRDCLYTAYLNDAYGLGAAEGLLEIPLDSITANRLRQAKPDLPRWRGVKYLDPQLSAAYQAAATLVAKRERVARVHLDAYWWGARSEGS